MSDDTANVDDKLAQMRKEDSHGTRADPADQPDFIDELEKSLAAVEDGDVSPTISAYDQKLAAILHALEGDDDRLGDVFDDLSNAYDADSGLSEPSRSAVIRLAVRVGLQEGAPQLLEEAREAADRRSKSTF